MFLLDAFFAVKIGIVGDGVEEDASAFFGAEGVNTYCEDFPREKIKKNQKNNFTQILKFILKKNSHNFTRMS